MSHRKQKFQREQGVFVLIFGVILMALLAFVALATDGANIIMTRLRLYNAIDSAIMTAPLHYVGNSIDDDEIKRRLDHLVRANFELDRKKVSDISAVNVMINLADVKIDAQTRTKLWLAPISFKIGQFSEVTGATKLRIPRVNVLVLLDSSMSMTDEADPFVPSQKKFATGLASVRLLSQWLRPNFDRLGIVMFNDYGHRLFDFEPVGGFNPWLIQNTLIGYLGERGSWTNMAEGLYEARTNFEAISYPPDDFNIVGILSDGFVSHGRANFDGSANPQLDPNTTQFGALDYHFQLESFDSAPLHHMIRYTLRKSPLIGNPPWFSQSPSCQTLVYIGNTADGQALYNSNVTPSCIQKLRIQGGDGAMIDLGNLTGMLDGYDADRFREMAYLSAIAQTDALRSQGVVIVAVGIGSGLPAPRDRFATPGNITRIFPSMAPVNQSAMFGTSFLRRLSLSPKGLSDVPFPQVQSIPALFAQPQISKFSGDMFEANSYVTREEIMRLVFGRMRFTKEF